MPHFKRYRRTASRMTADLVGPRRLRYLLESRPVVDTVAERWDRLHRHCADGGSRVRLERLFSRLGSIDPGIQESALTELELGARLLEVGASVQFLPESEARSADLECRLESARFFVEVTAMIGAVERARRLSPQFPTVRVGDEEPGQEPGDVLTKAILARIHQKAKQLRDYCDPVVLAISVPNVDPCKKPRYGRHPVALDIKTLVGSISILLPKLRHLSGVLLALWNVSPLPFKSGVRLGNVSVVERSRHQDTSPRVRMLIVNPSADSPLSDTEHAALKQLL
ncbi:MAG: hypothetical protein ACREIM_11455 [Nitrospiraceae bacterium]